MQVTEAFPPNPQHQFIRKPLQLQECKKHVQNLNKHTNQSIQVIIRQSHNFGNENHRWVRKHDPLINGLLHRKQVTWVESKSSE